ncbi:MAG: hypothetical protein IJ716_14385 [Lachnospiraceae bacterium]|nr:hypothetical protein [Lachnospiraceae bacterium]
MEKVIDIKDFQKEAKRRERKEKWHQRRVAVENWFYENKELAMILIPIAGTATVALVKGTINISKGAVRAHNLKKEEDLKNLYCYDRSLGHYWALRRELSNAEWIEIDRRKKNGERLSDILDELKVLK